MYRNILSVLFITFLVSCLSNKDILVVGHRGAMGHALENTIESVKKAIELNVDGIEIDVFKSNFLDKIKLIEDEAVEASTKDFPDSVTEDIKDKMDEREQSEIGKRSEIPLSMLTEINSKILND